jgi:hypothetical protein
MGQPVCHLDRSLYARAPNIKPASGEFGFEKDGIFLTVFDYEKTQRTVFGPVNGWQKAPP